MFDTQVSFSAVWSASLTKQLTESSFVLYDIHPS